MLKEEKQMVVTITNKDSGSVQTLDSALMHYLDEERQIIFQLRGGLLASPPQKGLYALDVKQDDGTPVRTFMNVLYVAYNFTMDESVVDGEVPEQPAIINNSIRFSVI